MSLTAHDPTSTRSVDRLTTAALAEIVSGLAVADELWRPHVAHDPEERVRIRLIATSSYEVWLLGWTPGQSVGLHDHGDANGAFIVVDGELTETVAAESGSRRSYELVHSALGRGDIGTVTAGEVHDVANWSTTVATSIHAYSRPLRTMNYYEAPGPHARGQRIGTLLVEPEPPRLTAITD